MVALSTAPIIVAMNLGGPTVAAWVALIGSTEVRELRGRIPWYGTLANHAGIALPAIVGGWLMSAIWQPSQRSRSSTCFRTIVGAAVFFSLNNSARFVRWPPPHGPAIGAVALRRDPDDRHATSSRLAPLAWLMARTYSAIGWWATLAVRPSDVHDADRQTRRRSRCARCSPRPSRAWPTPWTSGIRSRRTTRTG